MGASCATPQNQRYLPKTLETATKDIDEEYFYYEVTTRFLHFKLLSFKPFRGYLNDNYPKITDENDLTKEMLDVLHSYTDSRNSETYIKTNLNLLSANVDDVDWKYVNQLRAVIRCFDQRNLRHVYYRGLNLSDREIKNYLDKRQKCFFTTSFLSFTIDRLLIYPGNALMILRMDNVSDTAKRNLADIWKWSALTEEKEAILAVGSQLKILSVHFFGYRWEIEVELVDEIEL